MKKYYLLTLLAAITSMSAFAGLEPGDKAAEFSLKNVDGTMVSLADYNDEDGVILIFTCNPCPFAKAYEKRIIGLHEYWSEKGFPVVAINPNDESISPDDSFAKMVERAEEREYPFPYLKDEKQDVYKAYGASRTPHIYLLENAGNGFRVAYVGAIDDNAMDAGKVNKEYLAEAIKSVQAGNTPDPATTKAVGCTIKAKK
jgi:peroxiredoxin